jgi:S-DNA-T family DNA segregation ATPase FtsK/SpoIIIE
LQDLPSEQRQEPAVFDLQGGHLFVLGSARSGRSQLLRTLAGSAARSLSVEDLHIYGIDAGNGALAALAALPHTGAVASAAQAERVSRLIVRLGKEVERRQKVLASGGFADITEQRQAAEPADRLAHVMVLIDRWEGFVARFGEVDAGRLVDAVMSLLRDGAAVGVHVIATGDRSLGVSKMGSLCDNKIALRFADRGDYTYVGVNSRLLPEVIEPGRCFSCDRMVEMQVALLSDDESGPAQAAAIVAIAEQATARDAHVPSGQRPFRVDELPSRVSYEQAWSYPKPGGASLFGLVGVGGDELAALGPDLAVNATFIVAGPARSGRSSALTVIARSLLDAGAEIVIAAPRKSQLANLAGQDGVRGVIQDAGAGPDAWSGLLGVKDRPVVVVIDDGEMMRDSPVGDTLRDVIREPGRHASALILGGHAEGLCTGFGANWQVEAKKARQGLLLSPQSLSDGDLIGAKLTRGQLSGAPAPGRGLLHLGDGELTQVAIPAV